MKKLLLVTLIGLVTGCTGQSDSVIGASNSIEGTYFEKKQRLTLTFKQKDADTYLVDSKSLMGESKGNVWTRMPDVEIAEYFKGHEEDIKPGQYFSHREGSCTQVFIKYDNESDGYMPGCMFYSLTRFVKQ